MVHSDVYVHPEPAPRPTFNPPVNGDSVKIQTKRMTAFRRTSAFRKLCPTNELDCSRTQVITSDYDAVINLFLDVAPAPSEHASLFKPFIEVEEGERRCLLCGYKRINPTQMVQHIREHLGIYPFLCSFTAW
jgi:hypothetical protein